MRETVRRYCVCGDRLSITVVASDAHLVNIAISNWGYLHDYSRSHYPVRLHQWLVRRALQRASRLAVGVR
jgi:hypothetical protein